MIPVDFIIVLIGLNYIITTLTSSSSDCGVEISELFNRGESVSKCSVYNG